MFKILLCDQDLYYYSTNIFSSFQVDMAYSSDDILNLTYDKKYDLYIVNFNFYSTINELKNFGDSTTTIFIDDYYNILHIKKSFEIGDDYIIKPINIEELKIRVNYHYKKTISFHQNIINHKEFFYHFSTKQLFFKSEKLKLSPNEIKIVELLLINLNKPVSKDIIFETLESDSDASLRVHISKLKKEGLDIEYNRLLYSYTLI